MNRMLKRITRFALLLAFVIAGPVFSAAAQEVPEGKVYTYLPEHGNRGEIEVHFPKDHDASKAKVPAIIMFHGGAWRAGNRDMFRRLCHHFAQRGLVAATAHYPLASKKEIDDRNANPSPKRKCITGAKSAIRWVKANADELGIDPDRLVAGGGSAGGHVAMLATLNPGLNDPNDPKDIDTSVVAYLLFNPAFKPAADKNDAEVNIEKHLKADMPPIAAFWGTNDNWLAGWNSAYDKMKSLGTDKNVQWWTAVGQGHAFFNHEPWQTLTLIKADAFLVEQGLLKGQANLPAPKGDSKLLQGPQPKTDSDAASPKQAEAVEIPDGAIAYYFEGKNRCHVVDCRRLSMDPKVLVTMIKTTVGQAKKKGLPPCSRCVTDYVPQTPKKSADDNADQPITGDTTVYHAGKKRVHIIGCRRLTSNPDELAKLTKMTLAEAQAKGLPPCSRCPGSTTPGKSDAE